MIEKDGEMEISEYTLSRPFNLISDNNNETTYSINSVEYKNIKGSFRVFFCKKIDFSGFKHEIKNGKITDIKDSRVSGDSTAKQLLLFKQRLLIYFHEKNSSLLKSEKKITAFFINK